MTTTMCAGGTKPALVIYHAQCRDGWAAAWAASKVRPGAELFPAMYGSSAPFELARGREVIVADFSFSREEMLRLGFGAHLSVYDHHKTAEAALEGLAEQLDLSKQPHGPIVFDMARSGAGIVWDEFVRGGKLRSPTCVECFGHLHGYEVHDPGCPSRAPWIIRYVEDRDLWRWALPNSREVNAYLSTLPYGRSEHLTAWDTAESTPLTEAVAGGRVALQTIKRYAEAVCENARFRYVGGYSVPSVNAPQHEISEVLEHLLDKYEGCVFVHGWWQRADGMFSNSLRSRGEFDVSAIAKAYGGGGHRNAAGFQEETCPPTS